MPKLAARRHLAAKGSTASAATANKKQETRNKKVNTMRFDDLQPVPQKRHASGAFWPYCCATPDKFDAEEDVERAAFAFWKKTRGIYTATPPDAQANVHPKPGTIAQTEEVEAVDYEAVEVRRRRGLTNAESAVDFETAKGDRDDRHKEVSGRAERAEDVNFTSSRPEAPKDVDQRCGNRDCDTRVPRAGRGSRQRVQADRAQSCGEDQLVGRRGEKASSVDVAWYQWVRLSKHCEITGDTPDAVHARRRKGVWLDGQHTQLAPDGNLYVNPEEYNKWIESQTSKCRGA